MHKISGHTRIFGLLADPIAHVQGPQLFNHLTESEGQDTVLVPMQVSSEDLATLWEGLRSIKSMGGLIVTVPHKTRIPALCDEVGEAAAQCGAANAVRRHDDGRMSCEMFDGRGFVEGLRSQGRHPAGRRTLLVGAGGAASALAFALAEAGVERLTIANRNIPKAAELAERVAAAHPDVPVRVGEAVAGDNNLVINGTSLGLKVDDPLPASLEGAGPGTLIAEVVMNPEITPILAEAKRLGLEVHLGIHMLEAQIRLLAEFVGAIPCQAD